MKGPLLVIRADASHAGGTGHIMRTIALAQEWIHRGGQCTYLSATLPIKTLQRLENEGCLVISLTQPPASDAEAEETSIILQRIKPHWLLIDSYPLTQSYQSQLTLHPRTERVNVSDFGSSDCYKPNIIIHPNISTTANYSDLRNNPSILAGPKYILLRKELLNSKPTSPSPTATKLLITMGGSDPLEASYLLCKHLIESSLLSSILVRVIIGPAYPENGLVKTIKHSQIQLISSPSSMNEHYQWADTAICSPSTTALEISHYGIPLGLIITADNQENVLAAMLENKAAIQLFDARKSTSKFQNINTLFSSTSRITIASNAAKLVDGKGAQRICDAMHMPNINFRKATMEDAKILWKWTNDPVTRAASFNSDPIPWEKHLAWLTCQLDSTDTIIYIIESSTKKLGVIRYRINAETNGESIISISLDTEARGKGLAPLIISLSSNQFFKHYPDQVITAWIKPENKASIQTFTKANFENHPSPKQPHQARMRLENNPS